MKDLVFPGNLQDVMNRVLTAERVSEAQLVEARTKAQVQTIDAESAAAIRRQNTTAEIDAQRLKNQADAEAHRIKSDAELQSLRAREAMAAALRNNPALLRLYELEALKALAQNSEARIYIGFDKHFDEHK